MNGSYIGNVVNDLYEPENYYGLGICEWKIVTAVFHFKLEGAPRSITLLDDSIRGERKEFGRCVVPKAGQSATSVDCLPYTEGGLQQFSPSDATVSVATASKRMSL